MKFQWKIALVFCAGIGVLLGGAAAILCYQASGRVIAELGERLRGAAAVAALQIPGSEHEALAQSRSMQDPRYERLRLQLQNIQRELGAEVANIYTMRKTGVPDRWEFVVDASNTDDRAPLGKEYDVHGFPEMRQAFNGPIADKAITEDEWGSWLSAYAPIHDDRGSAVAILGLDASADAVQHIQWSVMSGMLAALAVGCLLSIPMGILAGRILARPVAELVHATEEAAAGNLDYRVQIAGNDELSVLANALNRMMVGLKERDFVKDTLQKYVSREVAERIVGPDLHQMLEGERRHVAVLFTDVRHFSSLAETMTPEGILRVLNQYFSLMIDVLFEFEGTLDKFIGDGLMGVFGAPVTHPNNSERAVKAALKMQERLAQFNAERVRDGLIELTMGIGINSGMAVAGNIGSDRRREYSVIGDTVNVAARLQELAQGGGIIISQATYSEVKDLVQVEKLEPRLLRGRAEPVQIYRVSAGPS